MELDQLIFKKIYGVIERFKRKAPDPELEQRKATLEPLKDRLTILARLICGAPIEIMQAEAEGGYTGNTFFLPATYATCENYKDNESFYIFRTCYLGIQKTLELNWKSTDEHNLELSRQHAYKSSNQVLLKLFDEFPKLSAVLEKLKTYEAADSPMLWGKWFVSDVTKELISKESLQSAEVISDDVETQSPQSELEGPSKELVEVVDVDAKTKQDYTLMHHFEKIETLDDYDGIWRDSDGSDELHEHEQALSELDFRQTVRVDDPVHSLYRSEYLRNAFIPVVSDSQQQDHFIGYDEWDTGQQRYLKNYCKVYPIFANNSDGTYVQQSLREQQPIIRQLRKDLTRIFSEKEQRRRQLSGEEVDLEQVVNNYAELRAGKSPSERIYLHQRHQQRDIAILLLLDLSLSTDAYIAGRRILDIEKQAVISFCEVLDELACLFQIDCFSSRTRNNCDYMHVKTFAEPWSKAKDKVGGLVPAGYTRIGPALRHASSLLAKEPSRKRWIILLSDGKPNDYDRYEGRYGIEDVRRAYHEAAQEDIHIFSLAIDNAAKHFLPRMFGSSAFRVLNRVDMLPQALSEFYMRVVR